MSAWYAALWAYPVNPFTENTPYPFGIWYPTHSQHPDIGHGCTFDQNRSGSRSSPKLTGTHSERRSPCPELDAAGHNDTVS